MHFTEIHFAYPVYSFLALRYTRSKQHIVMSVGYYALHTASFVLLSTIQTKVGTLYGEKHTENMAFLKPYNGCSGQS